MRTPTLSNRPKVLTTYRAVISEIEEQRGRDYSVGFSGKVADSFFECAWQALADCTQSSPKARTRVFSAPVGAGKTTFAIAFIVAMNRVYGPKSNGPYGCVFMVKQIEAAEDMYLQLEALLPGKVAVWTSDHDKERPTNPKDAKVPHPASRFSKSELKDYPVIVITHQLCKAKPHNLNRQLHVFKGDVLQPRAFTLIDEQYGEPTSYEIKLSDAQKLREDIAKDVSGSKRLTPHMDALFSFMEPLSFAGSSIETPNMNQEWRDRAEQLQWFTGQEARAIASRSGNPLLERVFGFARAAANDYAFVTRVRGSGVTYLGYEPKLPICAGTVLLDATASIDGVEQVARGRVLSEVPQARYDNLEIVHLPQHHRGRLKSYLDVPKNRRAYADWMMNTILEQTERNQKVLVVCKDKLITEEHIPKACLFEWALEGRQIAVTHWGSGVGYNSWKDAEVVILFDEFFIPRGTAAAIAQGLQHLPATKGELGQMKAINSKAKKVDIIWEGHTLRWLAQMALRGSARNIDEHGVCGKQKLVLTCDQHRLLTNLPRMFPGAKLTLKVKQVDSGDTYLAQLERYLGQPVLPSVIDTKVIETALGIVWRKVGRNFIHEPDVQRALANLGWEYRQGRGRRRSTFVRLETDMSLAAA